MPGAIGRIERPARNTTLCAATNARASSPAARAI
jgi:hypothetical protein